MRTYTIPADKEAGGKFEDFNKYIKACRGGWKAANRMIQRAERRIRKVLTTKPEMLLPPITICYTFYEPDRRRDKDHIAGYFHKVFQDSLVKEGLLEGDGWKHIDSFHDYFEVDKANPRIEIKIIEKGD